nr:MAG TPA: hypothetical protein [Caudoviricetes sp.]
MFDIAKSHGHFHVSRDYILQTDRFGLSCDLRADCCCCHST